MPAHARPKPYAKRDALLFLSAALAGLLIGCALIVSGVRVPLPDVVTDAIERSRPLPPITGSGYHEVWLLPVIPEESDTPREEAMLSSVNRALVWFDTASDDRLTIRATKVLRPIRMEAPLEDEYGPIPSSCDDVKALAKGTVDKAPDGTRVMLLVDKAWACPFGGLATLDGKWIIVNGMRSSGTVPARVVIHETGHSLGLGHVRVSHCPIMSTDVANVDPANCDGREYGDNADPMGDPAFPGMPQMNAPHLVALGWREPEVLDEPGRHRVVLKPLSLSDSHPVLLPDGTYVSFRAPAARSRGNLDKSLSKEGSFTSSAGVYIHATQTENGVVRDGVVLPFTSARQPGRPGDHYLNADRTISLRVDQMNKQEAWVTIRIAKEGRTVKDTRSPQMTITATPLDDTTMVVSWVALDPSGIGSYRMSFDGVTTVKLPTDRTALVKRPAPDRTAQYVTVTAYDSVGNATVAMARIPAVGSA